MLGPGKSWNLSPSLRVLVPRSLPLGRFDLPRRLGARLYAADVRQAVTSMGLQKPLYWTFDDCVERSELVAPVACVYHCLDLYRATDQECEMTRRASVVFAVSDPLVESHKPLNARCYKLPNGVDTEIFCPTRSDRHRRPRDLPCCGPLIGYAGSISVHMDPALIERVARVFPAAQVVLIGPVLRGEWGPQGAQREAFGRLKALKNVKLLGPKPVRELPEYLQAFDVCLLPGLRDDWNHHADPLKFLQYLAMGKPVVATVSPAVQAYASLCYPADCAEAFAQQAGVALAESGRREMVSKRRKAAEARRWDVLVNEACRVLTSLGYHLDGAQMTFQGTERTNAQAFH
jgi:teichuronic acid biosynthesis glycosyltransferase TuaH